MYDIDRGLHHLEKAIKFLSMTVKYQISDDWYKGIDLATNVKKLITIEKVIRRENDTGGDGRADV